MPNIERARLSPEAARAITDEIKTRAEELWSMLLDTYEGGAHLALGYESWAAYFEKEFGQSGRQGERLLDAGRVVRAIEAHSDQLVARPNEAQARELAPLAREDPEAAAEAWSEVVEYTEGRPTARAIREHLASSGTQGPTLEEVGFTREDVEALPSGRPSREELVYSRFSGLLNSYAEVDPDDVAACCDDVREIPGCLEATRRGIRWLMSLEEELLRREGELRG